MKRHCRILVLFLMIFLTSCTKTPKTANSNLVLYGWNYIAEGNTTYSYQDPYGVQFKEYRIFYSLKDDVIYATYYADKGDTQSSVAALRQYADDPNHYFISGDNGKFNIFKPTVFGKKDIPQFQYYEDADQVRFISVTLEDKKEYRIADGLSKEVWTVLKSEQEGTNEEEITHLEQEKRSPYIPIYLYLKGVKAAVQVAILCESTDGRLFISNMNYTKFYPMPMDVDTMHALQPYLEALNNPSSVWND